MFRGVLVLSLVLAIESSGNTINGDQCSSYETSDAFKRNCQRLVINNSGVERQFTLKFRYNRYRSYLFCSLCSSWCKYLASCHRQTWRWRNQCTLKFKYYKQFSIATVPIRKDRLPPLEIDVNLCRTINHRKSRRYDKIFTINITEHRNGMGSIKNVRDDGFVEDDDLLTEMMKSIQQSDSPQDAVQLFDDRIQQYLNGTMTEQEKMSEVILASTALEQFMLEFAPYHLNRTVPQIQFNSTHFDLQLRRNFYQREFLLQGTKGQNFVRIPAGNFPNGLKEITFV